jgi:hypothetical protein
MHESVAIRQNYFGREAPECLTILGGDRSGIMAFHNVGGVPHVERHEPDILFKVPEIGGKPVAKAVLNPIPLQYRSPNSILAVGQRLQFDERGVLGCVFPMPFHPRYGYGLKDYVSCLRLALSDMQFVGFEAEILPLNSRSLGGPKSRKSQQGVIPNQIPLVLDNVAQQLFVYLSGYNNILRSSDLRNSLMLNGASVWS